MLYGQALLLEGSKPEDPSVFAKYVSKLMLENLKKSGVNIKSLPGYGYQCFIRCFQ